MKYYRKLWPLLGLMMLLFYSCEQDDGVYEEDSGNMNSHPFVQEARAYFEEYASLDLEYDTEGLHPGLIAPKWEKAKVFSQGGIINVDVPLWTEASYEGSFYLRNDSGIVSSTDTYHTAILQKLIVVKALEVDALSCYIATIIPDAEHATQNSSLIDEMFYSGDMHSQFSGTVIYSTVTTNFTIQVERYKDGMLCEDVTLFGADADCSQEYEAMLRIIEAKSVRRSVRAVTRNGEFDGGSATGGQDVIVTGQRPNPTPPPSYPPPPLPSPWPPSPPVYYPPTIPPPTHPSSGGSGQSGGGQTTNTDNKTPKEYVEDADDKLMKKKLKKTMSKQPLNTCVTSIMEFLSKEVFGDSKDLGTFETYYFKEYGEIAAVSGVDLKNMKGFVGNFFETENFTDYKSAIDKGYAVMTDIAGGDINSRHNVAIVGYKQNGSYIYMDPAKGMLMTANESYFKGDYNIVVKNIKK